MNQLYKSAGETVFDSSRVDQAALMGAALAAVVALVLGPGAWDWLSMVIGLTLIAVLAALSAAST